MKHQFLTGVMLAASLMISCSQKKNTSNFGSKPITVATSVIPESPDTMLSNGRRNIFLVGRREYPGLFIERSIFPVAYRSYPHTHSGDLNMTVISGSLNLALTSSTDSAAVAKSYGPGSFMIIPANKSHFEWFTEITVMDISGVGPVKTINLPIVHSTN